MNEWQSMLTQWSYDGVAASNGEEAWRLLHDEEGPRLAILDWLMPGVDGLEVCRRVRAADHLNYTYILILAAKTGCEDLVTAMDAGADDYVTKPFKSAELRARLRVGRRILEMAERLQFRLHPPIVLPRCEETNLYSPE